jgi:glyoxylase-like metal-dependent hydrolase (beta-lactamase superfamily II)
MNLKVFEFNMLPTNTFVVWDDTHEAVIIDPACYFPREKETLARFLTDHALTVKHILLTHFHFDHVFGVPHAESLCGVVCEAHPDDAWWADNNVSTVRTFGIPYTDTPPTIGKTLSDDERITFGGLELRCIHTPGHSRGSMLFHCESEGIVFVGDTLFAGGGIGRTDLHGGDYDTLMSSIRNRVFALPDSTIVYPGHGPSTTLRAERWYHNL